MTLLHATGVAIGEQGVLVTGASGAGKSDLALRLIDRGAVLIGDDQVALSVREGLLYADAAPRIAGMIEVRGLGLISMRHRQSAQVALLIELGAPLERMPEPRSKSLLGVDIPSIRLDPKEPSAAIKAELALRQWGLGG